MEHWGCMGVCLESRYAGAQGLVLGRTGAADSAFAWRLGMCAGVYS